MFDTQSVVERRGYGSPFWFATGMWVLSLIAIFKLILHDWTLFVRNPFGPFLLIVLFGAAATVSWQWSNLVKHEQRERGTSNARQYFVLVGIITLLVAEFGLVLNHLM